MLMPYNSSVFQIKDLVINIHNISLKQIVYISTQVRLFTIEASISFPYSNALFVQLHVSFDREDFDLSYAV